MSPCNSLALFHMPPPWTTMVMLFPWSVVHLPGIHLTLVHTHWLLPMLTGQNWYNFPLLFDLLGSPRTMRDQPATKSPSLGPTAVLSRNATVPNNAGQGRRQKVMPNFTINIHIYLSQIRKSNVNYTGPIMSQVWWYPECANAVMLSAPTNMPPLYKPNTPFAP